MDPNSPSAVAKEQSVELWKPPAAASKADKANIARWFDHNEVCTGSSAASADAACQAREHDETRLRKHGWCWGAPLAKSAADNDWHRCGTYDTDSLSEADVGTTTNNEAVVDMHAADWLNEKERLKSPLLQAYENATEMIDQKIGLSNVMLICGIRGSNWHSDTVARLEQYRRNPIFEEMRDRLTPSDAASAAKFSQIVVDGTVQFNLGGGDKEKLCQSTANMPFVNDDSVFRP